MVFRFKARYGRPDEFGLRLQVVVAVGLQQAVGQLLARAAAQGEIQRSFQVPVVEAFGEVASEVPVLAVVGLQAAGVADGSFRKALLHQGVPTGVAVGQRGGDEELLNRVFIFPVEVVGLLRGDGEESVSVSPGAVVGAVWGGVEVGEVACRTLQVAVAREFPVIIRLEAQVERGGEEEERTLLREVTLCLQWQREVAQPSAALQLEVGGEVEGEVGGVEVGGLFQCGTFSLHARLVLAGEAVVFFQVGCAVVGVEAVLLEPAFALFEQERCGPVGIADGGKEFPRAAFPVSEEVEAVAGAQL